VQLDFTRFLKFSNSFLRVFALIIFFGHPLFSSTQQSNKDINLGPKVNKDTQWTGNQPVSKNLSILILAGHADSQLIDGSGTPGEAVALQGKKPMKVDMSDELFWNLLISKRIVKVGKRKGLNIDFYDPEVRTIINENDLRTNWSIGAKHAKQGGYPIEIHFDSYGEYGFGSGLIPPISKNINYVDESLGRVFGKYPIFFRGGLGAPRRQIRVLEIGKLEGDLEKHLRDLNTRENTIDLIANKIVNCLVQGINQTQPFNQKLDNFDIFFPNFHHQTNPGVW
tara:strand:+ start:236 stop:1078 length:843 start_codon:yes stop_codon:yes gene_type:complete